MNRLYQSVARQLLLRPTLAATTVGSHAVNYNSSMLCRLASSTAGAPPPPTASVDKEALDKLVRTNKVVIFMKGNPQAPRCGFSNAVVQILRMHGVQYDAHDVLQNEELRQSIKDYSDWPTIPQVFINGEFVGGCDILMQMHQSGDLIEELKKVGIVSQLLQAEEAKQQQQEKKK